MRPPWAARRPASGPTRGAWERTRAARSWRRRPASARISRERRGLGRRGHAGTDALCRLGGCDGGRGGRHLRGVDEAELGLGRSGLSHRHGAGLDRGRSGSDAGRLRQGLGLHGRQGLRMDRRRSPSEPRNRTAELWGCDAVDAVVSIRSLAAKGLENGFSANRALSVLHAAAALPINPTRAIRDTATQCPEPTRNRITQPQPNATRWSH